MRRWRPSALIEWSCMACSSSVSLLLKPSWHNGHLIVSPSSPASPSFFISSLFLPSARERGLLLEKCDKLEEDEEARPIVPCPVCALVPVPGCSLPQRAPKPKQPAPDLVGSHKSVVKVDVNHTAPHFPFCLQALHSAALTWLLVWRETPD